MSLPAWTLGLHHDGSSTYVSDPLPKLGDIITLRLRTPKNAPLKHVFLRASLDGESHWAKFKKTEHTRTSDIWVGELPMRQVDVIYRFKLMTDEGAYYYNAMGASRADSPEYYDFRIVADYHAPLWVRDTVFYQIFPDRFYNGDPANDVPEGAWIREGKPTMPRAWGELPHPWEHSRSVDFFGGDLQGITQKLDYITDLGCNGLYLTPIFEAASNHRYDITDFKKVDPYVGGDEGLAELRNAMDEKQMRLMLDITPNHVGITNRWFDKAVNDPKAPEASFFFLHPETKTFSTWLGVSSLIKLNYASQKLRDLMYRDPDSVMRHWMKPPFRIDSWRLDVANMTGNMGEEQLDHDVWVEMRQNLKAEDPEIYLIGEYYPDGTPHLQGDELDGAMNYAGFNIPVRRWLGGADVGDENLYVDPHPLPTDALALQWRRFLAAVPYVIALQQFTQLDSHDTTRVFNVVKGDVPLVKLGVAILMAFPGVPCIYYGSELGLDGGKDPDNRRCMPWNEKDWDQDLLAYHKQVIALRKDSPALKHGGYQELYAEGEALAFLRESPEQRIVFVGWRGADASPELHIPVWQGDLADGTTLRDLISGETYTVQKGGLTFTRLPHGAALFLEVQK
jgi:alpha-glucosidase